MKLALPGGGKGPSSRLAQLFSAMVSIAMLAAVAIEVRHLNLHEIFALIPRRPLFWAVFAAYYLVGPVSEWIIYRRLWHIPFSGLGALLRKLVSNELLLGYLGEVQFYAWARGRLNMVTAPFGAIKDVTILSALTGNIATLAMLAGAWKLISSGAFGMEGRTTFLSLGVVLFTSFIILLFRQKLFSLPRKELWIITGIHFARTLGFVGLSALLWHVVLPDVGLDLWLVLATLRMLVSRLPLIPNKDVVFAGFAVFILGRDHQIQNLMAMMAMLLPATHVVVGTVFATLDLIGSRNGRNA
ncbi:MAG: hypothetical protein KGJ57_20100 [Sphingomonadales bacterium]|nr:hypothetical protein [Sphingomonadales bacterium]MDE2171699.1 hypothetical protein [Sphingomonadales bacterium]